MIALAIIACVLLLAAGLSLSWYFDNRLAALVGIALACAAIGSSFVFQSSPGPRSGIAIAVDDSCDAAPVGPQILHSIRSMLARGVSGDAAVVLAWFAADARSTRELILALTEPRPASTRGDDVAFENWKAPRRQQAEQALTKLKTQPCERVGTSVVGAVVAANDELEQAQVTGPREIVLVTNLIEFSRALKIEAASFGPADVPAAVRAIAQLPDSLRPRLGADTTVKVLIVPVVRNKGVEFPLAEETVIALQTWAKEVFGSVLHAAHVEIDIAPSAA